MTTIALTRLVRVDEWDAMRAEVERLRLINHDLRQMVDGLETAAHEERTAVVAWLRERSACLAVDGFDDLYDHALSFTYERAASAVEGGEHRREEEP